MLLFRSVLPQSRNTSRVKRRNISEFKVIDFKNTVRLRRHRDRRHWPNHVFTRDRNGICYAIVMEITTVRWFFSILFDKHARFQHERHARYDINKAARRILIESPRGVKHLI